jgi:hypothetical protein
MSTNANSSSLIKLLLAVFLPTERGRGFEELDGENGRQYSWPIADRSSSDSQSTLGKPDMAHVGDRERERWLQRRNSLSSQRAVFPYHFPQPSHGRQTTYRPSTASSRTLHTSCSASNPYEMSDRSSTFTSTTSTTLASSASSRRNMYRRHPGPNVPSIPELLKSLENLPYEAVPALPKAWSKEAATPSTTAPAPAWCPELRHAPLSADPHIRALTRSQSQSHDSKKGTQEVTGKSEPQTTRGQLMQPPSVPRRAPGHSARPSVASRRSQSISTTSFQQSRPLRRPPSISVRHPSRQRLWSYTSPYASTAGLSTSVTMPTITGSPQAPATKNMNKDAVEAQPAGTSVGLGIRSLSVPSHGVRPSMYSVSSYGTTAEAGGAAVSARGGRRHE